MIYQTRTCCPRYVQGSGVTAATAASVPGTLLNWVLLCADSARWEAQRRQVCAFQPPGAPQRSTGGCGVMVQLALRVSMLECQCCRQPQGSWYKSSTAVKPRAVHASLYPVERLWCLCASSACLSTAACPVKHALRPPCTRRWSSRVALTQVTGLLLLLHAVPCCAELCHAYLLAFPRCWTHRVTM